MKTVYPDGNNVVLDENSVERKTCINRESRGLELGIELYTCHNINMNFLVVVTPPTIYQHQSRAQGKCEILKLENYYILLLQAIYGCIELTFLWYKLYTKMLHKKGI